MPTASKFSNGCQVKSISLPCRSHPTTLQIEELINGIKTTASRSSVEAICCGLSQLTKLYTSMDVLLNSSITQVLMSREENKRWVDDIIDESANFLDVCSSIRDMLSQIKDHSRDIYFSLRRRKVNSNVETCINKYISFRKKMKKDVKGLVATLKKIHNTISGGSVVVDSDYYQLVAVIKAVIGVSETTSSIFESLLMFFSVPDLKTNKWSLVVSKMLHKGMVACEDQQARETVNEFESVDSALQSLCKHGLSGEEENVQIAQCRLEKLGDQIENMESVLDSMFRCLVRSRVSLLNIISQ